MVTHEENLTNYDLKPLGYYDNSRKDMMDYIPDGVKKTLEFGCGTGGFSYELKKKYGAQTWAVEINPEAAKQASRVLDRVINKDAMDSLIDMPDDYFDCVLFFDILEHLVNPYELLTGIKPKLSSRGVIICSIPNIRYYRVFKSYIIRGEWNYKDHGVLDKTHLRFFTKKSIEQMFRILKYDIERLEGIHPTSSRTYKLINALLFNSLCDVRYKHYSVVAKPR